MTAIGYRSYFKNSWNQFDFVVIFGSLISILLSVRSDLNLKGAMTIIRAIRIMRIMRLIRRAKSLNLIFNTFVITIPGLVNIGGLLFLLIYLYSIMGM